MQDRHGKPLAVGDRVMVPAVVTECRDPDAQLITLVGDVPLSGRPYVLKLKAGQVEKV